MPIAMHCQCGAEWKAPHDKAGRKMRCPNCSEVLVVPGEPVETTPARSSSAKSTAASGANPKVAVTDGPSKVSASGGQKKLPSKNPAEPLEEDDFGQYAAASELPPAVAGRKPKKKPRKSDDEEQKAKPADGPPAAVLIGGAVFGLLLLAGGGFLIFSGGKTGGQPAQIAVPQNLVDFAGPENMFRCKAPEGFETRKNGGTGGVPASASFSKGKILISIKSSTAGAAVGDIGGGPGADKSDDPEDAPVQKVHYFMKSRAADEFSSYEETDPQPIATPYGDARIAEFVGKSTFGSTTYGYRATILGVQLQLNVICKCASKAEWEAYRPLFRQVIESISN